MRCVGLAVMGLCVGACTCPAGTREKGRPPGQRRCDSERVRAGSAGWRVCQLLVAPSRRTSLCSSPCYPALRRHSCDPYFLLFFHSRSSLRLTGQPSQHDAALGRDAAPPSHAGSSYAGSHISRAAGAAGARRWARECNQLGQMGCDSTIVMAQKAGDTRARPTHNLIELYVSHMRAHTHWARASPRVRRLCEARSGGAAHAGRHLLLQRRGQMAAAAAAAPRHRGGLIAAHRYLHRTCGLANTAPARGWMAARAAARVK